MNKKFYAAPEVEELMLETQGFLAASEGSIIEDGEPVPVNPGTAGEDDLM